MATTKVIDIIRRAQKILNDAGAVRWELIELQDWINDSYREIVKIVPAANTQVATVSLAAGVRQKMSDPASINLPNAIRVVDVVRNMAATSRKRAVVLVDREMLDETIPDWSGATASVDIANWMFDERIPKEFMVYPPAPAISPTPARVELAYSSVPAQHALSESALNPEGSNATVINLDDIYANAILDYVLYRGFTKDAESDNAAGRAVGHFGAFNAALGAK